MHEHSDDISEKADVEDVLSEIIEKYKTTQFHINASMYILPDGTLLDLGDSGFGHSNLSSYLNDCGIEIDYKECHPSKFLQSLGWIRVNNRYQFITLSNKRPTSNQYEQLIKLFDMYKTDYQVTTADGQHKVYNNRTSEEVIKLIKRYYTSGTLYEKLTA